MAIAVAPANENRPENAINDGIKRQPKGRSTVKLPTEVKKLKVNKVAFCQSTTTSNKLRAVIHIVSDINMPMINNIVYAA